MPTTKFDKIETNELSVGGSASALGVSTNVAYVDKSGNDSTGQIGNIYKPFLTAQAAYNATLSPALTNPSSYYIIQFGAGIWTGIILSGNGWLGNVILKGLSSNASALGGIQFIGANGENGTSGPFPTNGSQGSSINTMTLSSDLSVNLGNIYIVTGNGGSGGNGTGEASGENGGNGGDLPVISLRNCYFDSLEIIVGGGGAGGSSEEASPGNNGSDGATPAMTILSCVGQGIISPTEIFLSNTGYTSISGNPVDDYGIDGNIGGTPSSNYVRGIT